MSLASAGQTVEEQALLWRQVEPVKELGILLRKADGLLELLDDVVVATNRIEGYLRKARKMIP